MPRILRLEYSGGFYHVYNRGNRGEKIFWDISDYEMYESFLYDAINFTNVKLYAWCLMPNHFHMLVETPDGNLSQFMRVLMTRYSKYFNQKHKLIGHVFQGRYKSILCDKETYLLELVRYIHLNPIKVKSGSLCDRPENYRWSSYRYYAVGNEPESIKIPIQQVLKRFSKTIHEARHKFEIFVIEGLVNSRWADFYDVKEKRFLGTEKFVDEMKEKSKSISKVKKIKNISELTEKVESVFHIDSETLKDPTQDRTMGRIRKAFIYVGRKHCKFKLTDLANYIGRDVSAASKILRRMNGKAEDMSEMVKLKEALSA